MQRWWRKAVLIKGLHRCAICGRCRPADELDAHHLIRRRYRALRHDWRNGVPVCRGECHIIADQNSAKLTAQSPHWEHIDQVMKFPNSREYLRDRGMTLREFDSAMLILLKKIVKEKR